MALTPALTEALAMVADAAAGAASDWWIIGSAAMVLHGVSLPPVKDVDLLMTAADADGFLLRLGLAPGGGEPSDRFRSAVFGTWLAPPIPVEVMGGFSVATPSGWRDVVLNTRQAVAVEDKTVHVPTRVELAALLETFGREKDLERLKLLRTVEHRTGGGR